ncbi:MAG: hypothetical protein ACXWUG_32035 [Polyangiales bacterium]
MSIYGTTGVSTPMLPVSGKYTGPTDPKSGGVSDKLLAAVEASTLPPPELSIGELLMWMQKTMEKTDTAIREKMNDMVADQNVSKKYTDAIAALGKMEIAAKSGGGAVPSKELWDALDPDTIADLRDNVKTAMSHFTDDIADDGAVALDSITNLRDALKDAVQEKNSSHEMQMIQLQSDVSSRQQKFQMVSAIAHSLDETADKIIQRFG